jgi:hypothetical protein
VIADPDTLLIALYADHSASSPRLPAALASRGPPGNTGAPSVNETALAGHGELAFVSPGPPASAGQVHRALRRMPTPGMTPLDPHFPGMAGSEC